MYTSDGAKEKACCGNRAFCCADECMAWRWVKPEFMWKEEDGSLHAVNYKTTGYCGLVQK